MTTKEAEDLLKKHGLNEIKETRKFTLLKSFLSQFDNFLTLLLIAAGVIAYFVGERIDSIFIFLIVILNACFGMYQEFKAERALSSLKKMTISKIRVMRDGKEEEIDSRFLVPADLVYVEEGTKIPADCEVLQSRHLEINEASLTGESLPVVKNEKDSESNLLYMGTVVAKGRAYAQVLKTGEQTKFGQIAKTLSQIEEVKTPLQKKLDVFTKQIGIIGIAASLTVFILSFIQDKNLLESFIFAVSLAVAAVPEGLPAVMTITLAIGVERMSKKKAIVRKLNSIETLGSVSLVATDKTGTLTTNQMKVKKIWVDDQIYDMKHPPTLSNRPFSRLVFNGVLCSTASLVFQVDHGRFDVIGDATEGAILHMAHDLGFLPETIKGKWKIIEEFPFDPVTKRMTVIVASEDGKYVFTKGAPESILAISNQILIGHKTYLLDIRRTAKIENKFKEFARSGLRMIAFSYKENIHGRQENNQIFLGFVGIADPVREEAKEAVSKAKEAGIKVVMITGDNELTAEAIGVETGIIGGGEGILTGKQLDRYSDEELLPLLSKTRIFARTSPEHKHRLVRLFQKQGEVVVVTGDGVNDALALKQADVGVAMGMTGTDVAKETAHMIITDDNFATLINAIEAGRNIFNHIKNAIKYLLACNMGEVIYIIAAVVLRLPIITPLQLLYINLVTDGLPAVSLAFSPDNKEIMKSPQRRVMTILGRNDYKYIFTVGLLTAILALFSILPFLSSPRRNLAVTVLFTSIILIQHFILVDLWLSRKSLLTHLRLLARPIFLAAFFSTFFLHPLLLYLPFLQTVFSTTAINILDTIFIIFISSLILIPIELTKRAGRLSELARKI